MTNMRVTPILTLPNKHDYVTNMRGRCDKYERWLCALHLYIRARSLNSLHKECSFVVGYAHYSPFAPCGRKRLGEPDR